MLQPLFRILLKISHYTALVMLCTRSWCCLKLFKWATFSTLIYQCRLYLYTKNFYFDSFSFSFFSRIYTSAFKILFSRFALANFIKKILWMNWIKRCKIKNVLLFFFYINRARTFSNFLLIVMVHWIETWVCVLNILIGFIIFFVKSCFWLNWI